MYFVVVEQVLESVGAAQRTIVFFDDVWSVFLLVDMRLDASVHIEVLAA